MSQKNVFFMTHKHVSQKKNLTFDYRRTKTVAYALCDQRWCPVTVCYVCDFCRLWGSSPREADDLWSHARQVFYYFFLVCLRPLTAYLKSYSLREPVRGLWGSAWSLWEPVWDLRAYTTPLRVCQGIKRTNLAIFGTRGAIFGDFGSYIGDLGSRIGDSGSCIGDSGSCMSVYYSSTLVIEKRICLLDLTLIPTAY